MGKAFIPVVVALLTILTSSSISRSKDVQMTPEQIYEACQQYTIYYVTMLEDKRMETYLELAEYYLQHDMYPRADFLMDTTAGVLMSDKHKKRRNKVLEEISKQRTKATKEWYKPLTKSK
jgi:hypothetical protein